MSSLQKAESEITYRPNSFKTIVLFVDKLPTTADIEQARTLIEKNFRIIVVGAGSKVKKENLKPLSGDDDNVLLVTDKNVDDISKEAGGKTSTGNTFEFIFMHLFIYSCCISINCFLICNKNPYLCHRHFMQ